MNHYITFNSVIKIFLEYCFKRCNVIHCMFIGSVFTIIVSMYRGDTCLLACCANAEATAEADLDALRMRGNQTFADFLVEFNTLSSQVNWGDRALRHRLKHALPDRIKDSLALVQEPDVFVDWKRLVQNIDQRYWERQADIRRDIRPSHMNNTTRNNVPPTITRNPPQNPSAVQTTTSTCGTPGNPPVASHLNAQGGLTQTERDRRIAQGLCLYCGGQGHKASECSKAHKTCEKTGRAAQTTDPPSITPLPSTT